MTKLKNAPLLETVFEIRWDSRNKSDIDNFQLLIGELYSALSNEYDKPISMIPDPNLPLIAFANIPIYRFVKKDKAAIFQLGPGVLSVNCISKEYEWKVFFKEISHIVGVFRSLFQFSNLKNEVEISLRYIDFFDVDTLSVNLFEFLEDKLHIKIHSELFHKPLTLGLNTSYLIRESIFNLSVFTGKISENKKDGLIIESKMSKKSEADLAFQDWELLVDSFHKELNIFFEKLIEGELHDSFK